MPLHFQPSTAIRALADFRQRFLAHAWLTDLLAIFAIALVSRAALLMVGYEALAHQSDSVSLSTVLCRFDCDWYLGIAGHGYTTTEANWQPGATSFGFFPLFPLLVRTVAPLFDGNLLWTAIVATNCCFLGGLIYVYRYALLVGANRNAALLAVTLLCVFPQSIAFSVPYSESLFLLLLAAAIYHLLREQFLAAAIAAALLSATRPTGVMFIVFALACVLRSTGVRTMFMAWLHPQRYLPIVFAPLGMFAFWSYCFLTVGDAFAHSHTELHGWGYHFMTPWHGLRLLLSADGTAVPATLCSFAVFACSLLLLLRRHYAEFSLCLAFLVLIWSTPTVGSIFRYWLVLFPIWVEVSRRLEARPVLTAALFSALGIVNGSMMWAWVLQDLAGI
jgi:hypothetical protein